MRSWRMQFLHCYVLYEEYGELRTYEFYRFYDQSNKTVVKRWLNLLRNLFLYQGWDKISLGDRYAHVKGVKKCLL